MGASRDEHGCAFIVYDTHTHGAGQGRFVKWCAGESREKERKKRGDRRVLLVFVESGVLPKAGANDREGKRDSREGERAACSATRTKAIRQSSTGIALLRFLGKTWQKMKMKIY